MLLQRNHYGVQQTCTQKHLGSFQKSTHPEGVVLVNLVSFSVKSKNSIKNQLFSNADFLAKFPREHPPGRFGILERHDALMKIIRIRQHWLFSERGIVFEEF